MVEVGAMPANAAPAGDLESAGEDGRRREMNARDIDAGCEWADRLGDEAVDVALALNGGGVVLTVRETPGSDEDTPLRPVYRRLPDAVKEMLEKPLKGIRASRPDTVELLEQRLSVLEQARRFGGSVKLEERIERTRAVLDHARALRAAGSSVERVGDVVIRDDAESGRVTVRWPRKLTADQVRRVRSFGFSPQSGREAACGSVKALFW